LLFAKAMRSIALFRPVLLSAPALFVGMLVGACAGSPTGPDNADTPGPTKDPATAASLTFTADVQPLINNDCVPCHGGSNNASGVNLTSYASVMRIVSPGDARSVLILVTQPGGLMYGNWRGSASAKAETVRRWVVDFKAAQ
jgi:hypothetical protein